MLPTIFQDMSVSLRKPLATMLGVPESRVTLKIEPHPSGPEAVTFDVLVDGKPLSPEEDERLLKLLRGIGVEAAPLTKDGSGS